VTQLCAIPGCRIRNRHLPTCTDDCLGCLPRVADDGLICDGCVDLMVFKLRLIVNLTPDARLVAAGLVRRGSGGGSGKPGSQSPGNDDALDALDGVQNALTTITREIAETRGLQIPSAGPTPTDPLTRACSWLLAQMEWVRHATDDQGGAYASGVFAEIGESASKMNAIVNGPAAQRYLGPCGAPVVDFDFATDESTIETCDGDVYARDGASTGRCRTCGAEVSTAERQAWLDAEVRSHAYTAAEIAAAYPIKANTIRQWLSRGLLVPHGELGGRPLLNLGDVLDLAAGDAARRETARNERERRKAVRETAEMGA
jgi:hypothetical protein